MLGIDSVITISYKQVVSFALIIAGVSTCLQYSHNLHENVKADAPSFCGLFFVDFCILKTYTAA
jgi:hypothetical protein